MDHSRDLPSGARGSLPPPGSYGYAQYQTVALCLRAIEQLNGKEWQPGAPVQVRVSVGPPKSVPPIRTEPMYSLC